MGAQTVSNWMLIDAFLSSRVDSLIVTTVYGESKDL